MFSLNRIFSIFYIISGIFIGLATAESSEKSNTFIRIAPGEYVSLSDYNSGSLDRGYFDDQNLHESDSSDDDYKIIDLNWVPLPIITEIPHNKTECTTFGWSPSNEYYWHVLMFVFTIILLMIMINVM